jgi:hypothetical protein
MSTNTTGVYAVVVQRPGGHWARRSDAEGNAICVEAFVAQVKPVTDILTRLVDPR